MSDSPQFTLEFLAAAPPVSVAAPAPVAVAPPAPAARALSLTFSGTGAEYFRIWIVNLLLTIVTCGLYSAWAKVRRLQYFARNTELDGVPFDFHGHPAAILKGRLAAFVLLAGYQFSFGFSTNAGVAVFGILLLVLPLLLRSGLRFRFNNTSWRGLRFAFAGTRGMAYTVFVLPILLGLVPAAVSAVLTYGGPIILKIALTFSFLFYLIWPTLHHGIKRYQHANLRYAGMASQYTLGEHRFWPPYLLALCCVLALGLTAALILKAGFRLPSTHLYLVVAVALYIGAVLATPFIQARLGNLVWSNTAFPGLTMRSDMTFKALFTIQATNAVLTLATLGLFHPFAMVRTYRYRLAHMHVLTTLAFDDLASATGGAQQSAAAAGDFLGLDFAL